MRFVAWCIVLITLLCGCSEPVPDGRILVKNDSQDREYNVISVSGNGAYKSLKPGEHFVLPSQTTLFTVSRRYKDFTRSYTVRCPAVKGKGIYVKMIDIHVNRLSGGCATIQASR